MAESSNGRKVDNYNSTNMENNMGHIIQARRAAQVGNLAEMTELLSKGLVSARDVDVDDCSLLHWAAINNRQDVSIFDVFFNFRIK